MQNAQQAQPQPDFGAGPILNMYLASMDVWKNNYDALVHVPDERPRQTNGSGQLNATFDKASVQLQRTGGDIFRRVVELQIDLCRFFGKRWEQYLDLPSDLSHCRSAVDIAQIQSAFLSKMAADYGIEGRHLAQDFQEFVSNWMTTQPVPLVLKQSEYH